MKVDKLRTVIIYIIIILLGLVCLLPLLNIVASPSPPLQQWKATW